MVVTLGFIIFARLTTNLASNVIPPAYAFTDAFKMKHKTAVILIGILAVCTCPWILTNDSSAAGLVYHFCMKYMKGCERFRIGTSLEKK